MSAEGASDGGALKRIVVRLKVGDDRMGATDDPVFLRLLGPAGREFRLDLASGRTFRRGKEDVFVLGAPDDPETNVSNPELNDPTRPPLPRAGIERIALWKGMEPLPNVRGLGEMDDRLQVEEIEVELHVTDRAKPARFVRQGPLWLGLVCGQSFEIPLAEDAS